DAKHRTRNPRPYISRFRVRELRSRPGMTEALVKASGDPDDLAVEAIEAVIGIGLAGRTRAGPAADPPHPRPPRRPLDEGIDSGRQRQAAGILAVMDDQRARQRRRRTQ